MNWRLLQNSSFLRGLGVGLMLASILIIGWPPNRGLNQQEILQQAQQLGMVTKEQVEAKVREAVNQKQEEVTPPSTGEKKESSILPEKAPGDVKTVVIPPGSSSDKIADIVYDAGIIKDPKEFLALVEQKKVASRFRIGTYKLKTDQTLEEIIKVLTGKK